MANIELLEQLCTLRGISGDEESVRDFIVAQITPYAERVTIDAMGNVIAEKKGAKPAKTKLMLNAHMDEVGLIVTHIDNDGYLKFATVGGIDKRVLCGRSVIIGNDVHGVIGAKPIHLLNSEERGKAVPMICIWILELPAVKKPKKWSIWEIQSVLILCLIRKTV